MEKTIASIPDDKYIFEDMLEDDGYGNEDIQIKVTIEIKKNAAITSRTCRTVEPLKICSSQIYAIIVLVYQLVKYAGFVPCVRNQGLTSCLMRPRA